MKKFISLSLALALFTGFAAGCSEEEEDDSSTSRRSRSSSYSEEDTADDLTEEGTTETVNTTALTTTAAATTVVTTTDPVEPTTGDTPDVSFTPSTPIPVVGDDITGKWEIEKVIEDGEDFGSQLEEMGIPIGALLQLEFKSDGTFMIYSFGELDSEGTWTKNGSVFTAEADGEALDFELKNDRLVADDEGSIFYLIKVDNFTEYDFSGFFGDLDTSGDWDY